MPPVRTTPRTHAENRKLVCATCWRRADHAISPNFVTLVRLYLMINYSVTNNRMPTGICYSCEFVLNAMRKGDFRRLTHLQQDVDCGFIKENRNHVICTCKICTAARRPRCKLRFGRRKAEGIQAGRMSICSKCFAIIYRGE